MPQALRLKQQEPLPTATLHHPQPLIHLLLQGVSNLRIPTERIMRARAGGGLSLPQSRPEDVRQDHQDSVHLVRRGAGHNQRCFQTPLWLQLSCPGLSPQQLNVLQLWVPAQGPIKGVSSSTRSPPPGPVLGCSPGPEQRALSHYAHRWPQGPGRDRTLGPVCPWVLGDS